jgi:hypothetical protein
MSAEYTKGNGLLLNAAKTQLMYNSKKADEYTVVVDGTLIVPASSLKLLGVRYDQQLPPGPTLSPCDYCQDKGVARREAGSSSSSGAAAQTDCNRPRGGKIGHALAADAAPRLSGEKASGDMASLQVALNDLARTITGGNRNDRTKVVTLLGRAKLSLVNQMVVSAIGMEAWKAYWSTDGGDGHRNPVGAMLYDGAIGAAVYKERLSRSATVGRTRVPFRGHNTFVTHAANIWHLCPALREAKT